MRAAVMGAGSWGSVFSMILADAGCDVTLWARSPQVAGEINERHTNTQYVDGVELPLAISATSDPATSMADADVVVLAIPAQRLRENLATWAEYVPSDAVVVSLMKGVEHGSNLRMSQVIADVAGVSPERIAVVSGPNLAHEIALRQPAATTVACVDENSARRLQDACTTVYFRPYYTTDVLGVEIAGALKNVIALANGMAVGLGYGENAQAALMTRGLAEISRLGVALGANPMTFAGLAGVGDLIATCQSPLSRNRTIGELLGRGLTLDQAIEQTKTTSEGVKSCQPLLELATAHNVEMPITEQVVRVVHEGKSPGEVLRAFMSRPSRAESGQERPEHA